MEPAAGHPALPASIALPAWASRSRSVLLAATVLLIGAAFYLSVLIVQRQHALENVSRYNLTWLVTQSVPELNRLQTVLALYALPDGDRDEEQVQLWLDIFKNRLQLFGNGEGREFFDRHPELEPTLAKAHRITAQVQGLLSRLGEAGVPQEALQLLGPLNQDLLRISAAAYGDSSERNAQDLRDLTVLHWTFSGVLLALILCSLGLVGFLIGNNKLLRQTYARMQALVSDLSRNRQELIEAKENVQEAMLEAQAQNEVLQQRDRDLHMQNTRFDAALNNMSQGLCMVDAAQRLIVCNVRFLDLFDIPPASVRQGMRAEDLFRLAGHQRSGQELAQRSLEEHRRLSEQQQRAELVVEVREGRALEVTQEPMSDGGWIATYDDITERRRTEASIRFMAHHDMLTRLPNRHLFRSQVKEALQDLRPERDEIAVLCLDLDQFKLVNDTLGHPAGDTLLELVGQRLQGCLRSTEVVARLSGDEFAVLHRSFDQPHQAELLAQRIIEVIGAPYSLSGRVVVVGVSIGIAAAQDNRVTPDQLLSKADLALYRAKESGRGTYRIFEDAMEAEIHERALLEADLRTALAQEQLALAYQPIFDLEDGRLNGFETLLRWRHPQRGPISPAQFIPLAEEMGLIVPIGEWVLRCACAEAMRWPDPIRVAVNLSALQFQRGDIVQAVRTALETSGLPPRRLELEITESALLQDNERVMAILRQFRDLGISTALDDFGTGYSSLSYLRSFAFDKIKIDQSFVREMSARPDSLAIVNSIAALAHTLGMTTTAEGIERSDQLQQLREAGCTQGQGFLLGRPSEPAQLAHWMPALAES